MAFVVLREDELIAANIGKLNNSNAALNIPRLNTRPCDCSRRVLVSGWGEENDTARKRYHYVKKK